MPDDAVVDALADHVAPLDATDPGAPREALAPLEDHLDGATVVGLGECLHGGAALFHLKHRLLRHLVVDRGFRTLALEGDVARTARIDDAVRRDGGDPREPLSGLWVWPWKVAELGAVFEWLRTFNEGRPAGDRVRVVGVSPNDATRPAGRLRAFLADAAPDLAEAVHGTLAAISAGEFLDDPDVLDEMQADVEAVADHLDAEAGATDPEAGPVDGDDRARARLHCRAVAQAVEWAQTRSEHDGPHEAGMAHRDRIMADNVLRALEDDPGEGVALWAHDSHVQRGTFDDGTAWTAAETTGEHLDDALGHDYRPLGSEVGRGTVRAKAAGGGDRTHAFDLGEPPDGSLAAHLDAVGTAPAVLDLRGAAGDDRVAGWLADDPPTRWVGSVYDPDAAPDHHYLHTDLSRSFDALLYVGASGPTRPLGGV